MTAWVPNALPRPDVGLCPCGRVPGFRCDDLLRCADCLRDLLALSPKQKGALAFFDDDPKVCPYAAGTVSSLRKMGLVERVTVDQPPYGPRTMYRITASGMAAIGRRTPSTPTPADDAVTRAAEVRDKHHPGAALRSDFPDGVPPFGTDTDDAGEEP